MGRNKAHGNRQRKHINWISKRYPSAWRAVDAIRSDPKNRLWPEWCYLPIEYWWDIARDCWPDPKPTIERVVDVARLAALGAWRPTQGIYRFDPDLYAVLIEMPLTGNLADDLLLRLPSWCVYLETPGLSFSGIPIIGVYAHLDQNVQDGHRELRLLLDSQHGDLHLLPIPLRLGHGSLLAAVTATHDVAWNRAMSDYPDKLACFEHVDPSQDARDLAPILSLLLYLCADEADYVSPPRPRFVSTQKQGRILITPEQVREWDVGVRVGASLRQAHLEAHSNTDTESELQHAHPRPHWRRAHWHTYWTGPLSGERIARLKWIPPILVGLDGQALPSVIHHVKP